MQVQSNKRKKLANIFVDAWRGFHETVEQNYPIPNNRFRAGLLTLGFGGTAVTRFVLAHAFTTATENSELLQTLRGGLAPLFYVCAAGCAAHCYELGRRMREFDQNEILLDEFT